MNEGAAAASSEMADYSPDIGCNATSNVIAQIALEGPCNVVSRPISDFSTNEHGAAWLEGVQLGVISSGAKVAAVLPIDGEVDGRQYVVGIAVLVRKDMLN